ncbi:hypothetical protein [Mucilaginibacter sp.]|uniref:hypothetical protein n=1 Tax=Mucilaginibacter sp. TaxID=1882438 RepID=UPI0035BBD3C9
MKILFLLIISLLSSAAFGQKLIVASEVKNHVGETVILFDTIRSGKVYQDSTAVLNIGKSDKERVSVILSSKGSGFPIDNKVIHALIIGKASFKGMVVPAANGYLILVDGARQIKFNYQVYRTY